MLAVRFRNGQGYLPGSTELSWVRDIDFSVGTIGFPVLAWLMISAASNAVNLTDGLDGLAAGTSAMVFGAYVIISFWQFGNECGESSNPRPATSREIRSTWRSSRRRRWGPVSASCGGTPARRKIFMGDTGSLALGGAFAAMAIVTRTELLLVILGGLFVLETVSVILQVASFKLTGKRVFNMAPIHHHFELAGWPETTVIIRFWIIGGLTVALGLGLFYAEFLSHGSLH